MVGRGTLVARMSANGSAEVLPISVVIAAYNQAAMLERALDSAAGQLPAAPAEVIVVDDASADETAAVAERRGARLVRHSRNLGTAAARNSGVAAATQPWIALLDQDDEWLPHHLDTLWRGRGSNVLVAGSALRCSADGRRTVQGAPGSRPARLDPAALVFPGNIVPASAALVKREIVQAVGGFRPPDGVDDLDLWIRVLAQGPGVVAPAVTIVYHEHPAQASGRIRAMQDNHIAAVSRFAGEAWWSEALVERWRGRNAWNNVRSAVRSRRAGDAVRELTGLLAQPQRVYGAIKAAALRRRLRSRAGNVELDGVR